MLSLINTFTWEGEFLSQEGIKMNKGNVRLKLTIAILLFIVLIPCAASVSTVRQKPSAATDQRWTIETDEINPSALPGISAEVVAAGMIVAMEANDASITSIYH